jgi:hypothetical protein
MPSDGPRLATDQKVGGSSPSERARRRGRRPREPPSTPVTPRTPVQARPRNPPAPEPRYAAPPPIFTNRSRRAGPCGRHLRRRPRPSALLPTTLHTLASLGTGPAWSVAERDACAGYNRAARLPGCGRPIRHGSGSTTHREPPATPPRTPHRPHEARWHSAKPEPSSTGTRHGLSDDRFSALGRPVRGIHAH